MEKSRDISERISELYDQETRKFQKAHNHKNLDSHIWRHILHRRTFYFNVKDTIVAVSVEIVRFRVAHTNLTFTFYGSLFLPYTSHSRQLISNVVDNPTCGTALLFDTATVQGWTALIKTHNPGYGAQASDDG